MSAFFALLASTPQSLYVLIVIYPFMPLGISKRILPHMRTDNDPNQVFWRGVQFRAFSNILVAYTSENQSCKGDLLVKQGDDADWSRTSFLVDVQKK